LDTKGVKYQELIVDGNPALRTQMTEESGRTSVPQIWINEVHIGGCDELYSLERSAQLDSLLGH
jgi:glutaredoxin 3